MRVISAYLRLIILVCLFLDCGGGWEFANGILPFLATRNMGLLSILIMEGEAFLIGCCHVKLRA